MILVKKAEETERITIEFDPSMTRDEKINFLLNASWGFSQACDEALDALYQAEAEPKPVRSTLWSNVSLLVAALAVHSVELIPFFA